MLITSLNSIERVTLPFMLENKSTFDQCPKIKCPEHKSHPLQPMVFSQYLCSCRHFTPVTTRFAPIRANPDTSRTGPHRTALTGALTGPNSLTDGWYGLADGLVDGLDTGSGASSDRLQRAQVPMRAWRAARSGNSTVEPARARQPSQLAPGRPTGTAVERQRR